ncbi:MAG: hypothetical protein A3B99_04240 [Candidatus Yanofskybacteria bacterium RIFCSPHIGHO2_02_FULL_44_12b]|uniref:Glycosyl transferase family 1 domain-containing protein n=2 Tax=Candidatus Yanofskyibacteriota TaxID=1752733 RepID=A0A1F8GQR7_9BACT|nr:MAG: Glycosyltransferase [Candidatus Yanofskybacteria bacterium GW2011_GWA2_44_9]OGN04611.1 MAG: hypothetical protein A2659_00600 [Candidatus Yanofskybacteria bacterium RIFCSPHIGHO2_01_FULL_44_24]OGN15723.1 MAG: hypothetical protein A3B99_04240 [Candidatus Yanofskybacteria bacterium RIFCSPHIGHO2_02_FULL_44_12b]OGN26779.1 MAG: hypothetical protein A2925_04325 [Candidatus Yanofskybacteria bacterium RIFCSPLOWO2_01_FULL_44_22]
MTTSVLQALATGLPCITTNHGAFNEQIVDGKNGFMVPEGDYMALAEKVLYCMDHPELWPGFGRFGRQQVRDRFDLNSLMDRQVQIYNNLLSK